jgi:hypothetical protein
MWQGALTREVVMKLKSIRGMALKLKGAIRLLIILTP